MQTLTLHDITRDVIELIDTSDEARNPLMIVTRTRQSRHVLQFDQQSAIALRDWLNRFVEQS